MAPNTPLQPGEAVVREGRANLQRGAEAVGGHVYLTDRRLIFESHRFNVQRGPAEIPLTDITGVEKTWTKFLGAIPIAPNSIVIRTGSGDEYRVVVNGRNQWIEAINAQRGAAA
jgi:hypothetical protein